jgi:5'/3'-nucleotidase
MRILVTNDDGVDAPGLHALAAALVADGHDVVVAAPADDRSGAGAAIGRLWDGPPPVGSHVWDDLPGVLVHSIDAPPGAAVLAACLGAFGDRPDLIASGINPGANTGHLVLHSGTVGATLTGAGYGVPGVAVSMAWNDRVDGYHWNTAAVVAVAALEWAVKPDVMPRVLNINVPNVEIADVRGIQETELALHGEVWIASADVSGGDLRLEVTGRPDATPGTDVAAVRAGYVSVTPLMSIVRSPAEGAAAALAAALDGIAAVDGPHGSSTVA